MTESPSEPIDAALRSDHAAIRRALADLRANVAPDRTGELFEQLCADIVRHFVAEEQYLLPAVRDHLPDGHARSDAAFAEHHRVEGLLRHLDHEETAGIGIGSTLDELAAALDAHISAQEQHLLPELVAVLDPQRLAELGEGVLGAEQLAPTHPRALVPKSSTLNKITSWLTGLVDKSLDAENRD